MEALTPYRDEDRALAQSFEKSLSNYSLEDQGILVNFRKAYDNLYRNPEISTDPLFFQLYAEASWRELATNPNVKDNLIEITRFRNKFRDGKDGISYTNEVDETGQPVKRVTEMYIARLIRINIQKLAYERDDEGYPGAYQTIESWRELVRGCLDGEQEYDYRLLFRTIQSNIDERYANVQLIASIYPDRFPDEMRLLDVGSSINHGLKRLKLLGSTGLFPFTDKTIMDSQFNTWPVHDQVDQPVTQNLNQLMKQNPVILGESRGVDAIHSKKDGKDWVLVNCYPNEYRDIARIAKFNALEQPMEGIELSTADFSHEHLLPPAIPEGKIFHGAFGFMSYYQMTPDHQRRVVNNKIKYVQKNGIIGVFDIADRDDQSLAGFKTYDYHNKKTRPFGFKLMILDLLQKELGFQEIVRWDNGRCNSAILNMNNPAVRNALT